MKPNRRCRSLRSGYISLVLVLTTGVMLTLLTVAAYRRASSAQIVQSEIQLRVDYAEKEDAVLRAIVNLVPNRAIRAMQNNSNTSGAERDSLRWENIFSEALDQANARSSISSTLQSQLEATDTAGANGAPPRTVSANAGDSSLADLESMFDAIEPEPGFVAPGINRALGSGFPVPLETSNSDVVARDRMYPIISWDKIYGSLAASGVDLPVTDYPLRNVIRYPDIRFGYCEPGQPFVAKRNWWAFSMMIGENDSLLGSFSALDGEAAERDFIVSIYEIPSQLAISAEAFTKLGTHADGTPWQHTTIQGGVYSTRAQVDSGMQIDRISGRRGLTLDGGVTVGDRVLAEDPFAPGVREQFEVTNGSFLPVTLASESGRAAFVPINRGKDFFDRFAHAEESNTVSTTTWDNYSVGALQCAMRLDITAVASETDPTPTALRFQYFRGGVRQTLEVPLTMVGYFRPNYPFEVKLLHGVKPSIAIYPERFPAFLQSIGADSTAVNHSLVVNVDYSTTGINDPVYKPSIPSTDRDYGVMMTECADLRGFPRGFSLVTNLRLYIGDDFNVVATTPPAGSGLPSPFYPPASLFAPEQRYGTELDPFRVQISGQLGHLGGESDSAAEPVHLLDFKMSSEQTAAAANIDVNLRPITHPAELPPVTMMNWLVTVEERRKAFYTANGAN